MVGRLDVVVAASVARPHPDALLALASGDTGALWEPVTRVPTAKGIGDMPHDATAHDWLLCRGLDQKRMALEASYGPGRPEAAGLQAQIENPCLSFLSRK